MARKKNNHLYSAFFCVAVPILVWLCATRLKPFQALEYWAQDLMAQLRVSFQKPPDSSLLFVGIGDDSIGLIGKWPFARKVHGQFMKAVSIGEPAVVGWDLLFTDEGEEADDAAFVDGISACEFPVVLAAKETSSPREKVESLGEKTPPLRTKEAQKLYPMEGLDAPLPSLRKAAAAGFVDCDADVDGIRRAVYLVRKSGGDVYPTLSLQMLLKRFGVQPNEVEVIPGKEVRISNPKFQRRIPIDNAGRYFVNYRYEVVGNSGFASMDYAGLLQEIARKVKTDQPVSMLTNKMVLVGLAADGTSDLGRTQLSRIAPLPAIHLNVIDNILKSDYRNPVGPWIVLPLWIALAFLIYLLRNSSFRTLLVRIPVWVVLGYLAASTAAFVFAGVVIPVVLPASILLLQVLGTTGARALREREERVALGKSLAPYVSPQLLNEILKENPEKLSRGIRKSVAVMFTDLKGFTSLSERLDEGELVRILNAYFEEMVKCVNLHGGTLHKFIGDAVMVVWGDLVTIPDEEACACACKTALSMQKALRELNVEWARAGQPELQMRIGLHFGPVIVGNVGAPQRMEFTVIGDTVNLASRLEGSNADFGTGILVAEALAEKVKDRFVMRRIARLQVKGKEQWVLAYEVLGEVTDDLLAFDPEWLRRHDLALEEYFRGDFAKAWQHFTDCAKLHPEDPVCKLYIKFCQEYRLDPPAGKWDGVFKKTTK